MKAKKSLLTPETNKVIKTNPVNQKSVETKQTPVTPTIPLHLVKEPVVIQKSGDTDLRRGRDKLSELVEKTGHNPHDGNIYAFSNCKNTIKIIQKKEDGMMMSAKKMEAAKDWPEYQKKGSLGYTQTLTGAQMMEFLKLFMLIDYFSK
jgi:hypothetical protein